MNVNIKREKRIRDLRNVVDNFTVLLYNSVMKTRGIEKIDEANRRLAAWPHEDDYTARCYKAFISDADKRIFLENEIVRLTV